ncbi:hypothetical protein AYO44_01020 [Planctomycetaceae bacterium SCGC AG-212-F19]|nr:hypothetical protein AYO44_01020 [Planctomycetaceae bacterium SCGC AG-212-F19]
MNRRLLIQVIAPAVVLGMILFGACLVTASYINRLESNLAKILSKNVTSSQAAQELQNRVRQLRNHTFIYLIEPTPARLQPIERDHQRFEDALRQARDSAITPEEQACIRSIQAGYLQYRDELALLREEVIRDGPRTDFGKLSDAHPIRHVTQPCQELFRINTGAMNQTAEESMRVSQHANEIVLWLGLGGPVCGLVVGYHVARRLHRSIYRLSVRVQDMARHLDQKVASMSVVVDGDIENLDRQLQHVVGRVEETAQRLQRQQNEMLRAEQLAAVGQLAASVAHEVRNPLTSVKILVEGALRAQNPKPITGEDLRIIHSEVARVENTVQTFLNFARLPKLHRRPCDLRHVVAEALDLVRARARQQGVTITVSPGGQAAAGEDAPALLGFADSGQLCTVLINLFLNALDAMPRGGQLLVALQSLGASGNRLTVSDSGPGIAPEMMDRLFTPFHSTKPTGTGLGLTISQRIIEEHGGHIAVRNGLERGASFIITLPPAQSDDRKANGPASRAGRLSARSPLGPSEK